MPFNLMPDGEQGWRVFVQWLGVVSCLAFLGRLAWHIQQVKAGRRGFWSKALLWEVPLAVFCGVAGGGLGEWLSLQGPVLFGFVSLIAYLGPGGLEGIFERALQNYIGPPKR